MVLTSTGLGIGTSSPTEKLHVAGALRVTGAQTTAGTGVYLDYSSGIGSVNVYGPDNSTQGIWRVYTATANGGTGSEKLRLDSSGNLGLGVTPSAWALSGSKALQIINAGFAGYLNNAYVTANQYFTNTGASNYIANGFASMYIQQSGQHQFFTAASGTAGNAITFTQAMTLTAAGNLGLGTTSPAAISNYVAQTVNGTSGSFTEYQQSGSNTFRAGTDSVGGFLFTQSTVPIKFGTNDTERARITSGGFFGVNTSSPTYYVHAVGGANDGRQICVQDSGNNALIRHLNGSRTYSAGLNSSSYIIYDDTVGAYRFSIASNGNVNCGGFYTNTTASGANMFVDSNGLVYRSTSALKYKQNIRDLEEMDISLLRPVRYKSKCENDDQTKDHLGLIADEAAESGFGDLVTYGADGEVEGFQYERLTVVLLKKLQVQDTLIKSLKARLDAANL
jgi:hypothetical protein